MSTPHVVPVDDLVQHDSSGGQPCVCGPTTELVQRDGEPDQWMVVHHSLDGRELHEQQR